VGSVLLFVPFAVALVLMLGAVRRLRRARKIAGAEGVNVTTGSRMSAILSAVLMLGLSTFVLLQLSPQLWIRFAAGAGLAGGLEQVSLAASRGRDWLVWQNRAFAWIFIALAILIVAAELL
jgi:hypothetical protein